MAAQGKGGSPPKAGAAAKGAAGKGASPAKEETQKDKAAPYVKEGARAAAAGEWDDSYAEYAIAWSIEHTWEVALGLGKAAYKTKHYAEAIARLSYGLREAPSNKPAAKEKAEIEGWLQSAKASTGRLLITGSVGGDVLVDGEEAGKTPLSEPLFVDPGKHKIEVRKGTTGETKTADIVAGAQLSLDFSPPKVETKKTVVIVKEEGVFTPQVRTAAVIGGGALALAGFVAGGVALGFSFVKADEKKKAELDPFGFNAATAAAQAQADTQNTAIWCFVGGGVAAVGTGIFYLVTRPRAKAPVSGSIGVSPTGAQLSIHGSF